VSEINPRSVACPICRAKVGSPCMRPSGHAVFGGGFHAARRIKAATTPRSKFGIEQGTASVHAGVKLSPKPKIFRTGNLKADAQMAADTLEACGLLLNAVQVGAAAFDTQTGEFRFRGIGYWAKHRDWRRLVDIIGRVTLQSAIDEAGRAS
jgi:hypothetical protein